MQQHAAGVVGTVVRLLLELRTNFPTWKKFENRLRVDKITVTVIDFGGPVCNGTTW